MTHPKRDPKPLSFGSVCSGIEAASVAWHPLGWKSLWFSEIDKFPSAVLAHRYPETPNLGDMTALPERIRAGEVPAPDVFTGGTPCQAFSLAGLRKGLSDVRGNLSLVFVDIANAIDEVRAAAGKPPAPVVWENVPGVLSSKDNAFGCFLSGLAGLDAPLTPQRRNKDGSGTWTNAGFVAGPRRTVAWRILDAQHFGVAQRRRRVWVVAADKGAAIDPLKAVFEGEDLTADALFAQAGSGARVVEGAQVAELAPAKKKGFVAPVLFGEAPATPQHVRLAEILEANPAPALRLSVKACLGILNRADKRGKTLPALLDAALREQAGQALPAALPFTASSFGAYSEGVGTLRASGGDLQGGSETLCVEPAVGAAGAFMAGQGAAAGSTAFNLDVSPTLRASASGTNQSPSLAATLPQGASRRYIVRKLSTVECARLQGFPDNWTQIPWKGKPAGVCPLGPQYKAYGNSWAVPCAAWLGERIAAQLAGVGQRPVPGCGLPRTQLDAQAPAMAD